MANSPQSPLQIAYALQNPQGAAQLQNQQAIAQQLMAQGNDVPDPTQATPGPVPTVIKQSPLLYLAKALEAGTGGYLDSQNNIKQAQLLSAALEKTKNSQSTSGGGQLGNPSINPMAPLTGDLMLDKFIQGTIGEAGYGEEIKAKLGNAYAGLNKAAETQNTWTDVNGHHQYPPAPPALQQPGVQSSPPMPTPPVAAPPAFAVAPPAPQVTSAPLPPPPGANAAPAAPNPQTDNLVSSMTGYPNAQAAPLVKGDFDAPPSAQPQVDFNNPVAVKEAEAEATKRGDDTADLEKTAMAAWANTPGFAERIRTAKGAAPFASSGYGVYDDGSGHGPDFARSALGQWLDPKTAAANATVGKLTSQSIMGELGAQMGGMKPNKFLEGLVANGSGINMADPAPVKMQGLSQLQARWQDGLNSNFDQLRMNGKTTLPNGNPIPSKEDVAASFIPPKAIENLKAHPETAPMFEQNYNVPSKRFLGQ